MKSLLFALLAAATLAAGFAVSAASPGAGASHFALGVVQDVDRAARVATIAHESIESLKWPTMTMQFSVADAALFERLPAGRQVAFEFVAAGGGHRIVNAIPLAQAPAAPAAGGGRQGMGMHGGMGGDMAGMRKMCDEMMGGSRKH